MTCPLQGICPRLLKALLSMHHTRVKICGITRVEDALHAATQGVDAIGLVFYDKSPRCVSDEQAEIICLALPAFVTSVALFKDADAHRVQQLIQRVPVDLLQFHGSEDAAYCRQFGRPYIKALGMLGEDNGEDNIVQQAEAYEDARGILLDGHAPGADGGTGNRFDWAMTPAALKQPLILAGGLGVSNVAEAIQQVRPYAVDVSSGVEAAYGIKDASLVNSFMRQVKQLNNEFDRND